MVVCKFFQQGNCRFGQNCRFDHIYGSKYSYHAPAPTTQPASVGVTDEQLINQVQSDVQSALKGGQWILSSYSPFKEKPNFPGISDLSMEEARLFIYEAKSNNNLDQAVEYMNNMFRETRSKYEQLLQPSLPILTVLRSLYKGEVVASPFGNNAFSTNTPSNTATSIFRSAAQGSTGSIFGQPPATNSIFGQSTFTQNTNASIFDQKSTMDSQSAAKSIFAQATQNVFQQVQQSSSNIFAPQSASNIFDKPADTTAKSIFAQASQNIFQTNQNVFPGASPATQSVFAPSQNQNMDSPFSSQSTPFTNVFQLPDKQSIDDGSLYSDPKSVSQTDMEYFAADDFKLGFIPEIPPPQSVCF